MFRRNVKILKATIRVETNQETLLPRLPFPVEVSSLLTDFFDVEEIDSTHDCDGFIQIEDSESAPKYYFRNGAVRFKGPFWEWSQDISDRRFTFWGNQGFLYRYVLYLLEKKHRIYSFHACALFDEKKAALFVIIGGAGSGKTVFLLSGLSKGLRLLSTETVHFSLEKGDVKFYIGSLLDNIRFGTLAYDFPHFLPEIPSPKKSEMWDTKIALDLSEYRLNSDVLLNPRTVDIIFPRIEQGIKETLISTFHDRRKVEKILFDNISQKLTETVILYDRLPVLGMDEKTLAEARLDQVRRLIQHPAISRMSAVLSKPENCWKNLWP